jgi:hypothetical protein
MEYGPNYKFEKGRRGILKDDPTIKASIPEAGLSLGLAAAVGSLLGSKKKKKTLTEPKRGRRVKKKEALKTKYSVKPPVLKPKFSNIEVPVGKPQQTRKPQTLKDEKGKIKNVRSESQTFTKRQRPGRTKKETVKVNVVN